MSEIRICMVGSAMTDLIARVPRLPAPGETLIGSSFRIGFGGKGSNQAVMAARLGAKVSVVVKLGKDVFGENYLQNYKDQGINTDFVFFDEDRSSGVAPITVDDTSGQNSIVIVPGANDSLCSEDVQKAKSAITEAHVVICQLETPLEASLEAFKIARENQALTILNPAPARDLPDEILELTDIFAPNEVEAAMLSGQSIEKLEDAKQVAQALLKRGPKHVIITLGDKGAVFVSQGGEAKVHQAEQVKAVDTTGAGDAFVGSLAYFLGADWALEKAVARACDLATLSVQKPGTQTSYPYRKEVLNLLEG
ncbi:MAG: ribokinase [Trueperaceae bacterium]|nr:ribokinase [Trueperaceae bacterium]